MTCFHCKGRAYSMENQFRRKLIRYFHLGILWRFSGTVPLNVKKGKWKCTKKLPYLNIVWNLPGKHGMLPYILENRFFKFVNSYVGDTFFITNLVKKFWDFFAFLYVGDLYLLKSKIISWSVKRLSLYSHLKIWILHSFMF